MRYQYEDNGKRRNLTRKEVKTKKREEAEKRNAKYASLRDEEKSHRNPKKVKNVQHFESTEQG